MSTISVKDKNFWESYVTTSQHEAGKFLEKTANEAEKEDLTPDEKVEEKALEEERIHPSYRPIIYNYYYTDNSWNWGDRIINNVNIPEKKEEKKETEDEKKKREEEERANKAKRIGGAIFITAAAVVAYLWKSVSRQLQARSYTLQVYGALDQGLDKKHSLKKDLQNLVRCQVEIDKLNTGKITNYFLSAIGLLTSGAFLLAGGFKKTPWMITAGYIVAIFSAAFAAMNAGFHWNDEQEIKNHYRMIAGDATKQLNGLADKILLALRGYNDNMTPHGENQVKGDIMNNLENEYQPLYPKCYDQSWGYGEPSAPPVDG